MEEATIRILLGLISEVVSSSQGVDYTFYYSQDDGIKNFCKGLNPEQIKRISIWLSYSEKYVTAKVQLSPAASAEKESWRAELSSITRYHSVLRDALLNPQIIVP